MDVEDDRLLDLLDEWESRVGRGEVVSVAQLAGQNLELAARLEAGIKRLQQADLWLKGSTGHSITRERSAVRKLGPYELLELLGKGGMGAVFKARHTRLNKYVAVKVLPEWFGQNVAAIARFDREMKAVGALDHPNIVRAMDADADGGVHYLVMEFIEGEDVQKLVRHSGTLPVTQACRLIRDAAAGLDHAHRMGLVHRDIKPSNLLVTKSGQLKILDLGLARLAGAAENTDELTVSGDSLGTPDYMAPEQWHDPRSVDHRVDLYALGCTLYFMLVGRAPFAMEQFRTLVGKMTAHAQGVIPSLQDVHEDVPRELDLLFQQLLAKNPQDRVSSARELVERIGPFCAAESLESEGAPIASTGAIAAPELSRKPRFSPWMIWPGAITIMLATLAILAGSFPGSKGDAQLPPGLLDPAHEKPNFEDAENSTNAVESSRDATTDQAFKSQAFMMAQVASPGQRGYLVHQRLEMNNPSPVVTCVESVADVHKQASLWEFINSVEDDSVVQLRNSETRWFLATDPGTGAVAMIAKNAGRSAEWQLIPHANGRFALRNLETKGYLATYDSGVVDVVEVVANDGDRWQLVDPTSQGIPPSLATPKRDASAVAFVAVIEKAATPGWVLTHTGPPHRWMSDPSIINVKIDSQEDDQNWPEPKWKFTEQGDDTYAIEMESAPGWHLSHTELTTRSNETPPEARIIMNSKARDPTYRITCWRLIDVEGEKNIVHIESSALPGFFLIHNGAIAKRADDSTVLNVAIDRCADGRLPTRWRLRQ